jgi:hypothetical protein
MNKVYDYSGTLVSQSSPQPKLTTVKRTLYIDSGDRDKTLFLYNGSMVVYLPRVYERVVSINVQSAEFPRLESALTSTAGVQGGSITGTPLYFFLEIEGLNRSDETANSADRSAYVDSVFGKFQVNDSTKPLFYNESSSQHIVQRYYPALGRLDRLKLTTRLHTQPRRDYIYWPDNSGLPQEYGLTLEIETMENAFDQFSSMETRLGSRT